MCVLVCHNMWRSEDSSWEAVLFLHLWVKDLDSFLSDFVSGPFNGCLALGVSLSFPVRYLQVVYRDFSAHLGSSGNLFSYILVSVTASLLLSLSLLKPHHPQTSGSCHSPAPTAVATIKCAPGLSSAVLLFIVSNTIQCISYNLFVDFICSSSYFAAAAPAQEAVAAQ